MNLSDGVDRITRTFTADREYCDQLLQSSHAPEVAKLFVYSKWVHTYFNQFQEALCHMVDQHFQLPELHKNVTVWTLSLTAGIFKDICLIPYLVIRGLSWDAALALRRALEHAGVLTHLWYRPETAGALTKPGSPEFEAAFVRDQPGRDPAKLPGVRKRFASFAQFSKLASDLYPILSNFQIHGGSPNSLVSIPLGPTSSSCAFVNRSLGREDSILKMLCPGSEILCIEVATLTGTLGPRYGTTPAIVGEGGRLLAALVDPTTGTMSGHIKLVLEEIMSA